MRHIQYMDKTATLCGKTSNLGILPFTVIKFKLNYNIYRFEFHWIQIKTWPLLGSMAVDSNPYKYHFIQMFDNFLPEINIYTRYHSSSF